MKGVGNIKGRLNAEMQLSRVWVRSADGCNELLSLIGLRFAVVTFYSI